jgi:hypothetical protein
MNIIFDKSDIIIFSSFEEPDTFYLYVLRIIYEYATYIVPEKKEYQLIFDVACIVARYNISDIQYSMKIFSKIFNIPVTDLVYSKDIFLKCIAYRTFFSNTEITSWKKAISKKLIEKTEHVDVRTIL